MLESDTERIEIKEEEPEPKRRRLPGHEKINLQVGTKTLYQCTICRKKLTSNEEEICHQLKQQPFCESCFSAKDMNPQMSSKKTHFKRGRNLSPA